MKHPTVFTKVPSTAYDESNNNNVNAKNDGRTEEN